MVFSRNPSVNGGNISYLGYPITLTSVLILHVMGPGTCISKIYAIIVKRTDTNDKPNYVCTRYTCSYNTIVPARMYPCMRHTYMYD